ncbi:unnamed protein product [Enterobius vermicularis]|uniref:ANF_receptor domain-containing protein n=1 Tax=Enterobius vermicularis TaxID=51028 RepID=A0A0N4V763_ENTVE|nr:unnamed protein product [Enterobius vermicularis]
MCFGSSVSNSPLKSRILVVLVNAANWDSNGQFETVLSEILNEDIRESEIHWFRNSPPTCLPRNLSPSAASLSRIILYYGYGRNMDHLIAYCANFSSSKPNRVFVIVELEQSDVPHETALAATLALLTDLSKLLLKGSDVNDSTGVLGGFFVVVLISTSNVFNFALIASLYTDCIVRQLLDGTFESLPSNC